MSPTQRTQQDNPPTEGELGRFAVPRLARRHKHLLSHQQEIDTFVLLEQLGTGREGKVVGATTVKRSKVPEVAIKFFGDGGQALGDLARIHHQVQLHAECHDHPNVVTLLDYIQCGSDLFLVMESMQADAFAWIVREGPLDPVRARATFRDLASAVAHLHDHNIAHRDIKPENVLVNPARHEVKLCDFGLAVRWADNDPLENEPVGTVRCLPPEMFLVADAQCERCYNPKAVDVWGLGIVFFFLITGKFPFVGTTSQETAENIANGRYAVALPVASHPDECELIQALLDPLPHRRPSIHAVLAHSYFGRGKKGSV